MFCFTIRDVLALTGIAGASCVAGVVIWRADNGEELAGVFWLFMFGAACYALGACRPATLNRP
jgi:hypothetical protein